MSMRVSGGEELKLARSPGVPEESKACKQSAPAGIGEASACPSMPEGRGYSTASPLLGLLACRELMPQVLEHERALLVMKEHDYAKAPHRPEILQLAYSLEEPWSTENGEMAPVAAEREEEEEGDRREDETERKGGEGTDVSSSSTTSTLLNCRNDLLKLRESVGSLCEPVVTNHFREVVGLQVALLRDQQEQLYHKDNELNAIRKEKEQLEARLERMERRLAILQRQSRSKYGFDAGDTPHNSDTLAVSSNDSSLSTPRQTRLPRRDSLINSERHVRNRSSSVDYGSKRHRPRLCSRASTPTQDEKDVQPLSSSTKRSHKRKLSDAGQNNVNAKKPVRQPRSPAELRTEIEYTGLGLYLPKKKILLTNSNDIGNDEVHHQNSIDGPTLTNNAKNDNGSDVGSSSVDIVVPTWRILPVKASLSGDLADCEDLSDEVFLKRHKKLEEDEKRRKRWDIQRARSLREHEELLRKYHLKSAGQSQEKKKEKITTLLPKVSEIEAIEIRDTVVVSAFGKPIPIMKASEFELPWFDLDVREAKDSVRTTRSRAKATKPPAAESSTEES